MGSLSSVLKQRRKELGLTLLQIADAVGVTEATVQRWESGNIKTVRHEKITKLSEVLNVSPAVLMGWDDYSVSTIPPGFSPMPETSRVPRIGRIACGEPITAEENIDDYDEVLSSWHADFTLSCVGDSMLPKIEDGDVVAIRSQPKVENGEIAAVRIDGEATLKQVFYRDGYLELRPLNSEYESLIFIGEKMESVSIEGKAVGLCRNL